MRFPLNPSNRQATGLAEALRAFYAVHSPESIPKVPALAKEYLGRERELNEALMRKYGQDLASMAAQVVWKVVLLYRLRTIIVDDYMMFTCYHYYGYKKWNNILP